MSEQQFNGSVEQVAAGDIKNFVEAPRVEKEYLSTAQRQVLNALVTEISNECEAEARVLWREVYNVLSDEVALDESKVDRILKLVVNR